MAHHLIDSTTHRRRHPTREDTLAADLHALAQRDAAAPVEIVTPDPEDYATPDSWNQLTASVAQTIQHLDRQMMSLVTRLNDADARFQRRRDAVTTATRDLSDRIADALIVSPNHEYHLTDSFVSDRQLDPTSTAALDLDAQSIRLRSSGFQSLLHGPAPTPHRLSVVFEDARSQRVLRETGHRYGIVAGGAGGPESPDPEDLQVLTVDLASLTTESPHQTVDLEQVAFMDDRQMVALRRARQITGVTNVELRWPIELLRLGAQPPLQMTVALDLTAPAMMNRLIITQQPVNGALAGVSDVLVVTATGERRLLVSGPVREAQVAVVFTPTLVARVEWGLVQPISHPIPIHMTHLVMPDGLHIATPV